MDPPPSSWRNAAWSVVAVTTVVLIVLVFTAVRLAGPDRRFGRIDAWVNNAAVATYGTLTEVPPEEFRRVVEVNLLGTAWGMRSALRHLRRGGGGDGRVGLVHRASMEP